MTQAYGKFTKDFLIHLLKNNVAEWNSLRDRDKSFSPDLSHTKFNKTDLSSANLQECNLSYCDFSSVTSLYASQMAGSNLQGSILPPNLKFPALSTVEHLSHNAKHLLFITTFFSLTILFLLFNATPAELFLATPPFGIHFAGIFVSYPFLIVFLSLINLGIFVQLHLYMDKLWQEVSFLPSIFPDGKTTCSKIYPWIISGIISYKLKCSKESKSFLGWLKTLTASLLLWWMTPITFLAIWIKFLIIHNIVLQSFFTFLFVTSFFLTGIFLHSFKKHAHCNLHFRNIFASPLINTALSLLLFTALALITYQNSIYSIQNPLIITTPTIPQQENPYLHKLLSFKNLTIKNISLNNIHLTEQYLPNSNFSGSEIVESSFNKSILPNTSFEKAKIINSNLVQTNLKGSTFNHSTIKNTDLSNTELTNTNFSFSTLSNNNFSNATMANTTLFYTLLEDCNLFLAKNIEFQQLSKAIITPGTLLPAQYTEEKPLLTRISALRKYRFTPKHSFSEMSFRETSLTKKMLTGYSFKKILFSQTDLSQTNFSHALFHMVEFNTLSLVSANFQQAILDDVSFEKLTLEKASFEQALLDNVSFTESNLQNANFQGAILINVDFTSVNLQGANFKGANLKHCQTLDKQHLNDITIDKTTILPSNLD